ncbi:hypothetical protein K502DRAFT_368433 [Neoconidiobolus thromboides FSU 785]|nr:hypothetical protein K502DRAFT_368433 [Neoconidiobolus thromboides FSU 785]
MLSNTLLVIPVQQSTHLIQHGIVGIGMRAMLINGRALSTSSVKKPVNFKVNDEYLKSFNNQQMV